MDLLTRRAGLSDSDAYHEAARHDEFRRRIWAATRDEGRKRDFIDRCLGRRD